jgi:hypothetical protein
MALRGLVDSLVLLAAEAHLESIVTVFGAFLLLHYNAGARLDHRDRNHVTINVIELRHTNFFADKPSHKK